MLIGLQPGGDRIEAGSASKGIAYLCPGCRQDVIFAKGRIRRPYFAHRPGSTCVYSEGETWEHQQAKEDFVSEFRGRGVTAEPEVEVLSPAIGDRRADVLLRPVGREYRVALEVQHSSVEIVSLETRTSAYVQVSVPVIWIPIVRAVKLSGRQRVVGTDIYYVGRYAAPHWQRWMHDYAGHLWFYDPDLRALWRAFFDNCMLYQAESTWYEAGEERTAGGNWYSSERWKALFLRGPVEFGSIRVRRLIRPERQVDAIRFPGGIGAYLMIAGEDGEPTPPARIQMSYIENPYGTGFIHYGVEHRQGTGWATSSLEDAPFA